MKIAYYMPFKPMGHRNPSGDLTIGTELYDYLRSRGAKIYLVSKLRCRWLFLKPYLWPLLLVEISRIIYRCKSNRPDLWVTYHSYYKAPDIIGSLCCWVLDIPYVIFQGIYSTKRRKSVNTVAGFYLNRFALGQACCVFTNKKSDEKNLARLLSATKIHYIPPGLHPDDFGFDPAARVRIRQELQVGEQVIIMAAAMFRPGVKTEGLLRVISSCRTLIEKENDIILILVGDGSNRARIESRALNELGERVVILGKLPREMMSAYYSAADIFAFPGIEESLGMVYLEAQACGLPVVACSDWGAKEAVLPGKTGYLSPASERALFVENMEKLVKSKELRYTMGRAATQYVSQAHDIGKNYSLIWDKLQSVVKSERACSASED